MHSPNNDRSILWQVALLGGNSAAGKTYLANQLVERKGVSVLLVDDVRIAIQRVTTRPEQPDLHVFLEYLPEEWENPEKIFRDWLRVGDAMVKPLKAIILHHILVPSAGRVVIEGDGILPVLALQETYAEYPDLDWPKMWQVMPVTFLIEDDETRIMENLRRRGRGAFNEKSEAEQRAFAHASKLFADWLRQEATTHKLPVLSAQPRQTVYERFLRVLAG